MHGKCHLSNYFLEYDFVMYNNKRIILIFLNHIANIPNVGKLPQLHNVIAIRRPMKVRRRHHLKSGSFAPRAAVVERLPHYSHANLGGPYSATKPPMSKKIAPLSKSQDSPSNGTYFTSIYQQLPSSSTNYFIFNY